MTNVKFCKVFLMKTKDRVSNAFHGEGDFSVILSVLDETKDYTIPNENIQI